MNTQLLAMVREQNSSRRARLALQVQEQIDASSRVYLRLIERQTVLVEALIAAGIETLAVGDEVVIVSEMLTGEEVGK